VDPVKKTGKREEQGKGLPTTVVLGSLAINSATQDKKKGNTHSALVQLYEKTRNWGAPSRKSKLRPDPWCKDRH